MAALVTKKFRLHNAKQFVEALDEDLGFTSFANTAAGDTSLETNMYLFIGGISPWEDDTNAPTPTDTVANTYYESWRDMIAAKKITSSDATHCVPRYNWANNTAYYAYNHTAADITSEQFYVMTDEYNVYKCLANNNASGNSTSKPIGTGTSIITPGSDGYKWKFMYNISASKALKFVTSSYIPVQQVRYANGYGKTSTDNMPASSQENEKQRAVEVAAVTGQLNIINKTANGSGYVFEANSLPDSASHTTTTLILPASSSGTDDTYNGCDIFFTSGDITGEGTTITDYVGSTKTLTLASGLSQAPANGDNYTIGPKVAITGDGSGAVARANGANTTGVTEIVTVQAGQDYSNAVITISADTGSGANALAIIEPYGGHGYDAVAELGGYNVIINTRLENDESGNFTVSNDFRKIGLLTQPLFSNGDVCTATTVDQATSITLQSYSSSGESYVADQLVTGALSGATGRVVDYNTSTDVLRLVSVTKGTNTTSGFDGTPGSFQVNEALTVSGGDPTANTNGIVSGDMKQFSGDIIYIENRSPVTRASDQIEDIKLIINF